MCFVDVSNVDSIIQTEYTIKKIKWVKKMSRHKISIADIKNQISALQEKLDREEQKVNGEIGAWIQQKTKVESLQEFQTNFSIVPKEKKAEQE